MFIFIRYAATLAATARSTGGYAATRLRRYVTCAGECGEMRDGNQTTCRENGFRMNGGTEGPFARGKVLKEPTRFQRPSKDRGPYRPSGTGTGTTGTGTGTTGTGTCDRDRDDRDDHHP